MKKTIIATMAITPALAGCYPMEQAPLVYASKATVGVGVQAGTSDNPGLEMILGYKASDVALVPVAVAKHCRDVASDCTDPIFKVEIIRGGKEDSSSNGRVQIDLNGARLAQEAVVAETKALQKRQSDLAATLSGIKQRDEFQARLNALPAFSVDEAPAITGEREELEEKIGKLGIPKDSTAFAIQSELASIDQQIRIKTETAAQYDRQITNLTANLRNDISGNRDDSLSVYGTFGGGGQADAEKASLNGDKVFATGIAAQNLSEFKGVIDCLNGIKKLADSISDEDSRNKYISETSGMCVKK